MAITYSNRVGRIRHKLAQMLEAALPGSKFDPAELESTHPYWRAPERDCVSWEGSGLAPIASDRLMRIHVYCWQTMRECITSGFTMESDGSLDYEICVNEVKHESQSRNR